MRDKPSVGKQFVVISFERDGKQGRPDEKWVSTMTQAVAEARKRLKVRRLHKEPRSAGRRDPLPLQQQYGSEWKEIWNCRYKKVPKSHQEFRVAGGCSIHEMRIISKPLVNPFATKG